MPTARTILNNITSQRLKSLRVKVGSIVIGGGEPLIIQSMTNTNTLDTKATVEQCIRIIKAGGELVRLSVQGIAEAENLKHIKKKLLEAGYQTPLSADIHFNTKAAEVSAQYVEKVRINPGNYATSNSKTDYSEKEYLKAIEDTAFRLQKLIQICKKYQTAIRIGVNQGSLSSRILSKYGNTPEGMVESALEFVNIFEEAGFAELIISLKSSHVIEMVHANRLLAARMLQRGKVYPIHLGVTEAGNGMQGRQKSIAGMATLLNEGIGDTIRVSLTEPPENELPIAYLLRDSILKEKELFSDNIRELWYSPFKYFKRETSAIDDVGGTNPPVVILNYKNDKSKKPEKPNSIETEYHADYIYSADEKIDSHSRDIKYIQDLKCWQNEYPNCFPLIKSRDFLTNTKDIGRLAFVQIPCEEMNNEALLEQIKKSPKIVLVLIAKSTNPVVEWRDAFYHLHIAQINQAVILQRRFEAYEEDALLLEITKDFSSTLLDGFGNGIWLESDRKVGYKTILNLSFGLLQSCRLRLTQTDYIACPSCGRTSFNIEERLDEIRAKTNHLKHLKIAIMGCVVNGIGEMADADYGYVGSSDGKVNLYKGKTLMTKHLSERDATDALIALIKSEGDWTDVKDI